jgi:transcriptional regulator with XRE-family HTH domain
MNDYKLKGERLKKIRQHMGIKQQDFAYSLNISGGYLSELEKGKKKPGIEILNKLSNKYFVNIAYLFTGKGTLFLRPEDLQKPEHEIEPESKLKPQAVGDDIKILEEMEWYIKHIPVVRFALIDFFKNYLYEKRGMIEEEVKKYRKENPEEINK